MIECVMTGWGGSLLAAADAAPAEGAQGIWGILAALLALTALEIVLGIDNIIFIAVLADRLPEEKRALARNLGLGLALIGRIILLLFVGYLIGFEAELFSVLGNGISGKDIVLVLGGVFLVGKGTLEVYHMVEGPGEHPSTAKHKISFSGVITQIIIMDMVFSLDSVITAVGMVKEIWIMVVAVTLAMGVMLAFAGRISAFVSKHPTVKVLALAFLIMVGVLLIADGFDQHIPRGYLYFAMAFSLGVELVNMKVRAKRRVSVYKRGGRRRL